MIYYDIFGNLIKENTIEAFSEKSNMMDEIKQFKKDLETGKISKKQVDEKIVYFKDLIAKGKLNEKEKEQLNNVISTTVRTLDGLNIVGNLELGGIIKAKGFHLSDGTPLKTVTKTQDKLAVPYDKEGNINIQPEKEKGNVNFNTTIL